MIHELTVFVEIENDQVIGYGLRQSPMSANFAAVVLQMVADELRYHRLVNALGGPRRAGVIELPGNGPAGR